MQRTVEVYTVRGFTVEIASDSIFFTVRDEMDKPRGTIERPHLGVSQWRAYGRDGTDLGRCIGPRTALRLVANDERKVFAQQRI